MVKTEPDRDYYADLELQPSASANEIKKQFKKLALLYHPDRNPSGDTTAKFQAIQSANEILTDPQQRAKYDAQRIRSGQPYSYTDVPPPPPRRPAGYSNFPPPPPPPPMNTKKSPFSQSSTASGPQKYAKFNTPDPPPWRTRPTDDAKSKTNDFKAWEHMRHGQGPTPRGRNETKPPVFKSDRDFQEQTAQNTSNSVPRRAPQRKTEWENLTDAGMPRGAASRTKTSAYVPSTPGPGHDEPQARSAYFQFSQDRPAPSRAQSTMPPPASRAPTAKRQNPLKGFKSTQGTGDLSSGDRPHTQYPTVHGERTNLSPGPGLHRSTTSATPRDSNIRTESRDNEKLRANGTHIRSASASSPFRDPRLAGMASAASTSSSDSSSDDEEEMTQKQGPANPSNPAFDRTKQQPKSRRPHISSAAPQRSFFNPRVTIDEAKDESMVSDAGYTGSRRHSEVEIPTHKRADDPPEGFMEHRKKHEASQSYQQGFSATNGSASPHYLQRPKSFDEHYRRSSQGKGEELPNTAGKESTHMYESGFRWGTGELPKPFPGTPSLRSQSTENIDMKFSPSVNPPKFGQGSEFSSTQTSESTFENPIEISDGEVSPTKTNGGEGDSSPSRTPIGPPPKGPAYFYSKDWHQRVGAGTFQTQPGSSQSRRSSQRRTGTPRASSNKRSGPFKSSNLQPTVHEPGDEPPSYTTATEESLSSSRVSSEGSAMDIDPILTPPPSGADNNNQQEPPTVNAPSTELPPPPPVLPPRATIPIPPENDTLNFSTNDFAHVKPFSTSADGLAGIDDLSSALPFESRPSTSDPLSSDAAQAVPPQPFFKFTKPPKAPSTPKPLNQTTWESYLAALTAYMANWANFNNTMLSHFHIRQEAQRGMSASWMSATGDGEYNAYVAALREDEKVRKWWEVACERHRECVEELGRVRGRMKGAG